VSAPKSANRKAAKQISKRSAPALRGKAARAQSRSAKRLMGKTGDKKSRKTAEKRSKNAVGALFEGLVALQTRLRAPGGCPWDREQTHDSLRRYLIEETYEVLDALDSGDPENLVGELGDLLLQIVFHAEIARETRRFDIGDVIGHVHAKMVRRHPHVFGNESASSSAQVLKNWEQIKVQERREAKREGKHRAADTLPESILDGVPRSLPALLEAHQLTRRAANVGFDWQEVEGLFDKLAEETAELRVAVASGDRALREEEIGDLLFVCVNLARFLGFDAEISLKKANQKFSARFREMERAARESGQALAEHSTDELENLWDAAKVQVARSTRHKK
jgi:tetrapyrrole methylase family protein/MazG family protein